MAPATVNDSGDAPSPEPKMSKPSRPSGSAPVRAAQKPSRGISQVGWCHAIAADTDFRERFHREANLAAPH
jgi:hypothetical protein